MNRYNSLIGLLILFFSCNFCFSQSSEELWLSYSQPLNNKLKETYTSKIKHIQIKTFSETGEIIKTELQMLATKMLDTSISFTSTTPQIIIAKIDNLDSKFKQKINSQSLVNNESFIIQTITVHQKDLLIITGKTDISLLYGTYCFIKQLQLHKDISSISITDSPKIQLRILNHWDNLDGTVERGYAGFSIWDWHLLPGFKKEIYYEYARANASIGINGTVLNNVNSNAYILTSPYLQKVKTLADIFRPYGIKVYLTARFSAPIELGKLPTADPLNEEVIQWWKSKISEIYKEIPDFGGFLIKANSEGQPGPNTYGRSHVEGANMLATLLEPYQGVVMWRAFVYSEQQSEDRAKQAFNEFAPFDGAFKENVLVQVKNGPIDFQPREPYHPLFGAMPKTSLMMEFQITQEYLGQGSHLVFLPKLYEEVLSTDTYAKGKGSTIAKIIDGELYQDHRITGMAGVANIGTETNWTGHPFAQANWYGFGRQAWDPTTSAESIAKEWLSMTFTTDSLFIQQMTPLLINSREAVVNYMTPLGLHHIMNAEHHYGPGPWIANMSRPDWNSIYYHRADSLGLGFDRTQTGSNALEQYPKEIQEQFSNIHTIPEAYLLWFYHVPWDFKMKNGHTLWYTMAWYYQQGVNEVKNMQQTWEHMQPYVNNDIYQDTRMLLEIQYSEAQWWRNACLLYFQQFAKMPLPEFIPEIPHTLDYYKALKFPYAPGIHPSWN
ncbi:xylan alpha-1,2-glucuronidase [Neptunitalea chrysea]|uniref:Xylan alpha-1,2-glucuronidase n=1 Tax=Neptunitalea chrysea TaxID=1647581 RepID=A0A9W6B3H7_9FLAO|nr:alpha-glucuronidase family glycosyl hydrolase [Neptunitalea chrysea]GLB51873.1 xylan alpha-1,2-glucuronidase [Neptunitalea chrysea]